MLEGILIIFFFFFFNHTISKWGCQLYSVVFREDDFGGGGGFFTANVTFDLGVVAFANNLDWSKSQTG